MANHRLAKVTVKESSLTKILFDVMPVRWRVLIWQCLPVRSTKHDSVIKCQNNQNIDAIIEEVV